MNIIKIIATKLTRYYWIFGCILVILMIFLNFREVKLSDKKELSINLIDPPIISVVVNADTKEAIENKYNIQLPNADFNHDEYIYISYGREIKKISYSYLSKIFSLHFYDEDYPGTFMLGRDYTENTMYVYIGNKKVPPEDVDTKIIYEESN